MAAPSVIPSARVESSEPVEPPSHRASAGGLGTFRALRHRNYRLFFVGQMISLVGTWLHNSVLIWLAGELTKTSQWPSLWPSLVGAAQLLPVCLLGVWGGALADRWPRRNLLVFTQVALAVLAVALGGLTFAGVATVWHLLVIATLTGVVNAIDMPARLAFLAEMVGREDLVNAVGLNSLLFNIARVAGPLAGSFLLPQWGPAWCFVLNGLSFIALLAALALMRVKPHAPEKWPHGRRGSLLAGARFVLSHPQLRWLLPLTGVMALFGWPIIGLLPALARMHLDEHGRAYGLMFGAIGAGALLAALLVASFGAVRRGAFLVAGVVLAPTGFLLLSVADGLAESVACCGLVGVGLVLFFATSQGVFQISAGDHNRGRVMALYTMVLAAANPLGYVLGGVGSWALGENGVLRVQGVGILLSAAVLLAVAYRRR